MKKNRILLLLFTVFFVLCMAYVFRQEPAMEECVKIAVLGENDVQTISLWRGEDGTYFGFLPAYAAPEKTFLQVKSSQRVLLNDTPVDASVPMEDIRLQEAYSLQFGEEQYTVVFVQSANVPAMFLETGTGTMRRVHKNKEKEEKINAALYSADAEPLYIGKSFSDTISGHGNTTWKAEKKPYNLTFSQPQKLFGTSGGRKWVLLANDLDPSNIRNYLIYQLARRTADGWNPDCEFVDLYLNGQYAGLYLLCEKVEAAEGKIRLSEHELLLNMDITSRAEDNWIKEIIPGLSAEVRYPKFLFPEKREEYDKKIKEIIRTVRSGAADEEYLAEHIDLQSWAWKYILEEIAGNFDAGACSQFMSFDGNVIKSQSAWDYDNSLGNTVHLSAGSFLADRLWKDNGVDASWFHSLLRYEAFRAQVRSQFEAVYQSELDAIVHGGIEALAQRIRYSAAMDEMRWPERYSEKRCMEAAEQVQEYLAQRMDFLMSAWVDGQQYHMICLKGFVQYLYFSVADGMRFEEMPDIERMKEAFKLLGLSEEFHYLSGWVDEATGQVYDPNQPITHDMVLIPIFDIPDIEWEAASGGSRLDRLTALYEERFEPYMGSIVIPIAALFAAGGILWCRDRKLYLRKKAGKEHGTKVSP